MPIDYLSEFIEFVKEEFDKDELKDIALYGCNVAGAHEYIFYDNATKFWNDNLELCEGASEELAFDVYDVSLIGLIKHLDTKNEEWHNIKQNLLFELIEYSANYLVEVD